MDAVVVLGRQVNRGEAPAIKLVGEGLRATYKLAGAKAMPLGLENAAIGDVSQLADCAIDRTGDAPRILHKAAGIKKIIASTYQAVSGTGRSAIVELEQQIQDYVAGKELKNEVYAHQIAFNVLPQIGSLKDTQPGYTSEEAKMLFETHKILGKKDIKVSTTCVRVPVFNAHSEAINIEFEKPITPEEAREVLAAAEGVQVIDDVANAQYPLPIKVSGETDVFVGRVRVDDTVENGLALFVVGDNIRKGAAQNAIQIAEKLIEMGL